MFITFEGGEGTGKSTQAKMLAARLLAEGAALTISREPGGTPEGEALRGVLVSGDVGRWSAEAEALLNYAARDSHLRQVIRPALARGETVLCDRFMDSTRAYQGYAGSCSFHLLDELERSIIGDTVPALTLIFDLDPALGLSRAQARGGITEDRYERKGFDFHVRLRAGFLAIARAEPGRCKVIDASESIDMVASQVWQAVHG